MTDDLKPDPIDEAIAATEPQPEPKVPTVMRWDANPESLPPESMMTIVVPYEFTADHFEACVAILLQMRATVVQRQQKLVVARPRLVGLDGNPIQ